MAKLAIGDGGRARGRTAFVAHDLDAWRDHGRPRRTLAPRRSARGAAIPGGHVSP